MSFADRWLRAPLAPIAPLERASGPNGANGTNGTSKRDLEKRVGWCNSGA